jgi:hypothetical protein
MARLCSQTHKIARLSPAGLLGLLGLGLFLSACGGGSGGSNTSPQTGPDAILNGATLATATSHWVSTPCSVQAELTSDYGFLSVVTDDAGATTMASEEWAIGTNQASVTVGPALGLKGAFWISALDNIARAVSSQTFTANVVVETESTPQSLGSCTFTLTEKGLSLPAAKTSEIVPEF